MSQESSASRDYFRVPASLTIRLGPDSPEGRQAMALDEELWQAQSGLEQRANGILENLAVTEDLKPLLEVIHWLDFKLDLVLYQLRSRELDQFFPIQTMTTDVSGSGMGLKSAAGLSLGDLVLLALNLPDVPARPLYASGQIVRTDPEDDRDQAQIGVKFLDISETNRERLIRFNFRQQRRALAARSAEEEL
jgi:hypothetical protein